jgi:hypothetical protein
MRLGVIDDEDEIGHAEGVIDRPKPSAPIERKRIHRPK